LSPFGVGRELLHDRSRSELTRSVPTAMPSSRGVACRSESCPPCVSPYCLGDPSAVVSGVTRQPALRCSASAAVLAVSRMNDPLVGFGSPSECGPKRSQRLLRIAAAFVRFCPLQRVRWHAPCPDVPGRTFRLRRFDALDGSNACCLRQGFPWRPLLGFALRSFSLSLHP
jgi:hypothetical protein